MAKGRRGGRNKKRLNAESNDAKKTEGPLVTIEKKMIVKGGGEAAATSHGVKGGRIEQEGNRQGKKHKSRTGVVGSAPAVSSKHRSQSYAAPKGGTTAAASSAPSAFGPTKGGGKPLTALQHRMKAKLEGAKFRLLNEQLYTTRGDEAFEAFSKDPALFHIYHTGYREQAEKWPLNPLHAIIAAIKASPNAKELVVADFGCGDAQLALECRGSCAAVHSFDLCAPAAGSNPLGVVACDMAHVPLPDQSAHVAVFCLSLMGVNLADYLREARRVLKRPMGMLKVAEVRSRLEGQPAHTGTTTATAGAAAAAAAAAGGKGKAGLKAFVRSVEALGFKCTAKDTRNAMFVLLDFVLHDPRDGGDCGGDDGEKEKAAAFAPKPCIYKRR